MTEGKETTDAMQVAFIGFGEAAAALVEGWGTARAFTVQAYDIKTDSPDLDIARAKGRDYEHYGVSGAETSAQALDGAEIVYSMVTAEQALAAAQDAAPNLTPGALYLDLNSCAPDTKRAAAAAITTVGGRYVDVAVMLPVHPALHQTPLLVSGPYAEDALGVFEALDMRAGIAEGGVGAASSIKMIRSIIIKGMEALVVECVLSAVKAGVEEPVVKSLAATYPGIDWPSRAAYMLERVAVHGERRAGEMREVVKTVEQLGFHGIMARATAERQQQIGDLHLVPPEDKASWSDYRILARDILTGLGMGQDGPKEGNRIQ